jgi:hypothetical protein
MKALSTLVALIFLSTPAWSVESRHNPFQGAVGTCYSCMAAPNPTVQNLRNLRNSVIAKTSVSELFNVNEAMNFATKCESFVDEEGLGKWGNTIVEELHRERYEALYQGTDDLKAICPGFSSLNDNSKELVWVMILNAMVHLESSCDKTETARGPNGGLVGLLQLHRNREQVYAQGCKRGDGLNPASTFRCGLSMLNRQLSNDEALFSRKSYWDVLRPQARSQKFRKVQASVKKLSVCK